MFDLKILIENINIYCYYYYYFIFSSFHLILVDFNFELIIL